jgi:hypothetical protein
MGILEIYEVERIHHCAPLHYLPFICTSNALLSKPSLRRAGFHLSHFRSTSSRHDVARGFGNFVHLTLGQLFKDSRGQAGRRRYDQERARRVSDGSWQCYPYCQGGTYQGRPVREWLRPGGW